MKAVFFLLLLIAIYFTLRGLWRTLPAEGRAEFLASLRRHTMPIIVILMIWLAGIVYALYSGSFQIL